jgi:undecaprenyl-diphosphatase
MMTASIDDRITIWIATHRWQPLDGLFVDLGTLEKLGAVWIALALVFGFARWRRIWPAAAFAVWTGIVVFAADAASFGVKDIVSRPRPFVAHRQIHSLYVVHSSSFPAGHAATAFAGAVLLSWIARRWTAAFVLLAVAIAYSRIYVGDHYLGDVIGGAFLGSLVALASVLTSEVVLRHRPGLVPAGSRLRDHLGAAPRARS